MEIVKDTTFEIGWIVWHPRPDQIVMTVVVKGTFDLVPSGACPIAEDQAFLSGDEHHDGDIERSLRHASDFALFKPRGECLLAGTFRAPAPVTTAAVAFRVGSVEKRLALVGDRAWKPGLLGGATDPAPFDRMPLAWERAFGGTSIGANPVGRGVEPALVEGQRVVQLPNIETPGAMVRAPGDRPAPAGAFPIAPAWPARAALTGTYDAHWQRTRWPNYPRDFDWAHFNAAPKDQQIEGYFRGDEEIELRDLHPSHRMIACRLPGLRARAFLKPSSIGATLREIPLQLDTIAIDVDGPRACCVWRGIGVIARASLDDVSHVLASHEPIGENRPLAAVTARFEELCAARAAEDAAAQAPQAGAALPPPVPPERAAELRERVVQAIAEGRSCAGWELIDVDLSGLDLRRADLRRALLTRARLASAVLDEARLDGAILHAADLGGASLRGASLAGAVLTSARGAGACFDGAVLDDAEGEGASLAGARFAKASLRRADLSRADLTGARFEDAALDDADLAGASLDDAIFLRCTLIETSLQEGARARRARFEGSDLTRVRASEGIDLTGAFLRGVTANGARLGEARLTGADLAGAALDGADLAGADLGSASLDRCSLRKACLSGAKLRSARMAGCDLFEARLDGADLGGADLTGASLFGAEVLNASFTGARLDRADLGRTKLA